MKTRDRNNEQAQGLELFFAMYAVGLVLGIEEISKGLYNYARQQWTAPSGALYVGTTIGLFLAILLLIVRLFWSTGNIRRALSRTGTGVAAQYLVIHLPILLIQGVLVLFVCFSFVDYLPGKTPGSAVLVWFVSTTLWNALWLLMLVGWASHRPESFWLRNNFVFVVIAATLLGLNHWSWLSNELAMSLFVVSSLTSSIADLALTAPSYLRESGH